MHPRYFSFFRFPQQCSRDSAEDESSRDSRGQAVQGVQSEEDVRLALEGARPVPHQLAALQVWGDVLHADGLNEAKMTWENLKAKDESCLTSLKTYISLIYTDYIKSCRLKIINPGVRDVISLDLVKYAIAVLLKLTFSAQSFDFFLFLFVFFVFMILKKTK